MCVDFHGEIWAAHVFVRFTHKSTHRRGEICPNVCFYHFVELKRAALKRRGQTCKDSFWVAFPLYCTEQQVCVSLTSTERDRSTTDPHFSPQREKNLMLDYSWRCKYKPLALFLPLLLHYYSFVLFFFASRAVSIAVGNLMDVWCLRLESIPSQNTDSLYVQLSHAIPVWMTLDPGAAPPLCDVHMQCLLFVTTGAWRWSCVTKYELKKIFPEWHKSLEERRVAMVSIPSCLYSIQWTFWKLPVFVAVLHSEWYEWFVRWVSVVIFTLWRIRSGWREILIRFSNVVPITEFFLFFGWFQRIFVL